MADTGTGTSELENFAERIRKNALMRAKSLYRIWNRIGFSKTQIEQRCRDIEKYQLEMLEAMEEEERENEQKILQNIERLCKEQYLLCKELGEQLPSFEDGEGLLSMESRHKAYLKDLQNRKEELMVEVRELIAEDEKLSERLAVEAYPIPNNKLPSPSEKAGLKEHIHKLRQEVQARLEAFKSTRKALEQLFEELEMAPRTSFEVEIFKANLDTVTLSSIKMRHLKELHDELETRLSQNKRLYSQLLQQLAALWERLNIEDEHREEVSRRNSTHTPSCIANLTKELQRCEELKRQNMKLFIDKIRQELIVLWEKCHVGQLEREDFVPFYSDNYSDDLLAILEKEVSRYNELYEENKDIFVKFDKRNSLWNKMKDLEAISKDPGRLFGNRGCKLLQEEKERKRLQQELPRVEGELVYLLNQYEATHGRPLKIDGQDFRVVVEEQWRAYQEEKEMEKMKKLKEKQVKLEEERKAGAKPMTPLKRRFGNGTTLRAETASPLAKRRCPAPTGSANPAIITRRNLQSTFRPDESHAGSSGSNDTVATTYSAFAAGIQRKAGKENCRSSATVPRRRSARLAAGAAATPSTPVGGNRRILNSTRNTVLSSASPGPATPGKTPKLTINRNLRPFLI